MILHPNTPREEREHRFVTKFGGFTVGMASQIKLTSSNFDEEFFGLVYEYHARPMEVEKVLKALWNHLNTQVEGAWDVIIIFNNQRELDLFVEKVETLQRGWKYKLHLLTKKDVVWTTRLP